jgi:adenylate kinase
MKIVIFGPQGSGKGTQAETLARRHGLAYISTGDIFRYNIEHDTELGRLVKPFVVPGKLVPDDVTDGVIRERLQQPDCAAGFVLDGFPRDKTQSKYLSTLTKLDLALYIRLSDEWAIDRLSSRLACICGVSYNTRTNPPKQQGICDHCGKKIFHRADDEPAAIHERLALYHSLTEPLLDWYRSSGILIEIDGQQGIEKVAADIEQAARTCSRT